ncbi:MAG: PhnD/SsuA/transferrin family substrate-binding protein, partial [Planctomycetota bacterium]|nr:PhnD/SsuA/transferrin family substrate-binding protein [Planctomycetota bacterium]
MVMRLLLLLAVAAPAVFAEAPREFGVRLGIISYDSADDATERYRALFAALSSARGAKIQPRIALGTYAEVLHWVNRGLVDVAVLSPGAFAELR